MMILQGTIPIRACTGCMIPRLCISRSGSMRSITDSMTMDIPIPIIRRETLREASIGLREMLREVSIGRRETLREASIGLREMLREVSIGRRG